MAPSPKLYGFGGVGPGLLVGSWVLTLVAITLMFLRLYSVSTKAGRLRWDFVWLTQGVLWGVASQACLTVAVIYGLGNNIGVLTFPEVFAALKWTWIALFVGIVATVINKFAIVALLLEVQYPDAYWRRGGLWLVGAILALTGLAQITLSLTKCEPIPRLWNPTIVGSCPRTKIAADFSYWQGALNAAVDIGLSLMPITLVWNLKTDRRVKIAFCALMATGAIPSAAVIVRTLLLRQLESSTNVTHDFAIFMIAGVTELWTVSIISSIPPLRPLFLRLIRRDKTASGRTRGDTFKTVPSYYHKRYSSITSNGSVSKSASWSVASPPKRSFSQQQEQRQQQQQQHNSAGADATPLNVLRPKPVATRQDSTRGRFHPQPPISSLRTAPARPLRVTNDRSGSPGVREPVYMNRGRSESTEHILSQTRTESWGHDDDDAAGPQWI